MLNEENTLPAAETAARAEIRESGYASGAYAYLQAQYRKEIDASAAAQLREHARKLRDCAHTTEYQFARVAAFAVKETDVMAAYDNLSTTYRGDPVGSILHRAGDSLIARAGACMAVALMSQSPYLKRTAEKLGEEIFDVMSNVSVVEAWRDATKTAVEQANVAEAAAEQADRQAALSAAAASKFHVF